MLIRLQTLTKKGLLLTAFAVFAVCGMNAAAQSNPLGADEKFYALLQEMGPELTAGETVTTATLLENCKKNIDNTLAYEYLWRRNRFIKPEESHCHPVGYVLNKESQVAILIFFKGEPGNMAYWVELMTYNYKKGKLSDQIAMAGAFNAEGSAGCSIEISSPNLVSFKNTTLVGDTEIIIKINNKGVIDRK